MSELLEIYNATILAMGAVATLMFAQLLIADVVGIMNRHVPGTKVPDDHGHPLFRVTRTVMNTNESIGIFVCAVLFCMFSESSPAWTAYSAWAYFALRLLYAVFYYTNQQTLRSVSFGMSLLAILSLLLVGFLT